MIKFLEAVKNCSGQVTFNIPEGDVLNLKSLLSQYLFATPAGNEDILASGTIEYENSNDFAILMPFCQVE